MYVTQHNLHQYVTQHEFEALMIGVRHTRLDHQTEPTPWLPDQTSDAGTDNCSWLMKLPAAKQLMTHHNKYCVLSRGHTLITENRRTITRNARVPLLLVIHLLASLSLTLSLHRTHTLELARSAPRGLNTPGFIVACCGSDKQRPSATVPLWRRTNTFTHVAVFV